MTIKIIAITGIFIFNTIAWVILGSTIFDRTYSRDSSLETDVVSNWGSSQTQLPPIAYTEKMVPKVIEYFDNGKKLNRTETETITTYLPIEGSKIDVDLNLEHRQKGLLWYSTYKVSFSGLYTFQNSTDQDKVNFKINFPASQAIYDDLIFAVNDQPLDIKNDKGSISGTIPVEAGKSAVLKVSYKSQGLNDWRYKFGGDVSQVKNFNLKMTTNFKDIDFPQSTLSPTEKLEISNGWELSWNYKNLLSGFEIGMVMPEKLQPGPLAGRISFFAPVSLFFFFFLMFIITTLRGIDLHPMNYFFLGTAFFSFHLLLAYLVDHISIHIAFLISSAISILLVISYLRLVVGFSFAVREAGLTQLIYLVMFSYAFFFKGFTGLAITIGSILTLFVVMQMTGKIRWSEKFNALSKESAM
jgi:inner membrane protein involved in colicin E2 resistance